MKEKLACLDKLCWQSLSSFVGKACQDRLKESMHCMIFSPGDGEFVVHTKKISNVNVPHFPIYMFVNMQWQWYGREEWHALSHFWQLIKKCHRQ